MSDAFEIWYALEFDGGCKPEDEMENCRMAWEAGRKSAETELAEANAARERAEAKCADMLAPIKSLCGGMDTHEVKIYADVEEERLAWTLNKLQAIARGDNPGQPLLDKLARVEALIAECKPCNCCAVDIGVGIQHEPACGYIHYSQLEQALKGL